MQWVVHSSSMVCLGLEENPKFSKEELQVQFTCQDLSIDLWILYRRILASHFNLCLNFKHRLSLILLFARILIFILYSLSWVSILRWKQIMPILFYFIVLMSILSSMGFSYGCLVYICYSFLIQDAQPIPISYFFFKNLI